MSEQINCDTCSFLVYDEELEEYVCDVWMDEDEYARVIGSGYRACPYFRDDDEYRIVRHQM